MKSKSDFPEEFLSGYLDGELTESEMLQLEHALAEDPVLRKEYHELRASNGDVAKYFRQSLPKEPLNLWASIEKQISPRRPSPSFARMFEPLRVLLSHPSGFAAAGVFGVAMFAFGMIASKVGSNGESTQVAKKEILVPIIGDSRQLSGDVRFVSDQSPVRGFAPRFVSPHTLREDHPARNAGYSTDTVEIEWMKCPRSVKIVRPEDTRELPPVLWIGEER